MVKQTRKYYFNGLAILIFLLVVFVYFLPQPEVIKNVVNPPLRVFGQEMMSAFAKDRSGDFVLIDKGDFSLYVYNDFKETRNYTVTTGRKVGTKRTPGDDRTPQGIFRIKSIDIASHWAYDFPEDTLPGVVGVYGKWFIRLDVPGFEGIGIHGFINDDWLGKKNSNGCIRLNNEELDELVGLVEPGMLVIIQPSEEDIAYDLHRIGID